MFGFFRKEKKITEASEVIHQEDYSNIEPLAKYFHNETGITFNKQMSILKSKVTTFCKQRDIHSFTKLLDDIKENSLLKQELTDYLTTNETFFYREAKQIRELVELVRNSHANISILCAPSATGEEAYSIAIALLEGDVPASNFRIVGIDINSNAISKARKAVYGERNVRNLSAEIVSKYFTKRDNKYALNSDIRSLVTFQTANIFDSSFTGLGKFDFVFSRNMLIYFDKKTKLKAKSILESMRKSENYKVFFGHADLF